VGGEIVHQVWPRPGDPLAIAPASAPEDRRRRAHVYPKENAGHNVSEGGNSSSSRVPLTLTVDADGVTDPSICRDALVERSIITALAQLSGVSGAGDEFSRRRPSIPGAAVVARTEAAT
jgi:hypothetical protein